MDFPPLIKGLAKVALENRQQAQENGNLRTFLGGAHCKAGDKQRRPSAASII